MILEGGQGSSHEKNDVPNGRHERQLAARARLMDSLGLAAVEGAEGRRAELRAPDPAALAAPRITAHGAADGLHAKDTVAAHRHHASCARVGVAVSVSVGRASGAKRLLVMFEWSRGS